MAVRHRWKWVATTNMHKAASGARDRDEPHIEEPNRIKSPAESVPLTSYSGL
jgi:hypothetical protein